MESMAAVLADKSPCNLERCVVASVVSEGRRTWGKVPGQEHVQVVPGPEGDGSAGPGGCVHTGPGCWLPAGPGLGAAGLASVAASTFLGIKSLCR